MGLPLPTLTFSPFSPRPPRFLAYFRPFLLSESVLFCRAKGTAQSLERGSSGMDLSTKFGKGIPSQNLREKRSEKCFQNQVANISQLHLNYEIPPNYKFYPNWERRYQLFGGPCFCLLSSHMLGQVQVRQVGSRSRAKNDTRCQLNISIFEEESTNISTGNSVGIIL